MAPTPLARFLRRAIKRFLYSQLYLRDALLILFGRGKPLVMFNIEADPPSIYLNFRIRPDRIAALEDALALPDGLVLAPLACLEGEEPFFALTLNAYRVSGLANGERAEWSVYVRDAEGKPRYLVVEARSNAGSMDPVNIVTRAHDMSHALSGDRLRTHIVTENGGSFDCDARVPPAAECAQVLPAREWIEANDYIYWRNGLCDRTFYNGAMMAAPLRVLPLDDVRIEDKSGWNEFVDPSPVHAVLLSERVQLVISPWWNV